MRSMFSLSEPMAAAINRTPLALVLMLDPAQVLLRRGAAVAGVCRLSVGHQHQQLDVLRPVYQPLRHKAERGTVPVTAPGRMSIIR